MKIIITIFTVLLSFSVQAEGIIVGKWRDSNKGSPGVYTIFKSSNTYKVKAVFDRDGSVRLKDLVKSTYHGRQKYTEIDNRHGEFYVVEKNGQLGMYDGDGRFLVMHRIK